MLAEIRDWIQPKEITCTLASTSKPRKELFAKYGWKEPHVFFSDSGFEENLDKASFATPSDYVKHTSHGKLMASL